MKPLKIAPHDSRLSNVGCTCIYFGCVGLAAPRGASVCSRLGSSVHYWTVALQVTVRIMTALSLLPEPAEYISGSSAVPPAGGWLWLRLAFYNIGWDYKSKKSIHTQEGLAKEICDMVQELTLDAVGISEVYNLKDDDKHDERQVILRHLLSSLNSSAARPASSDWAGRSDGHYIFVWNSNQLVLKDYEFVSCGINEHSWRRSQYLQFQSAVLLTSLPLHVIHNHSPSSSNSILTDNRRN